MTGVQTCALPISQIPVLVVEPTQGHLPTDDEGRMDFVRDLRRLAQGNPAAESVQAIVFQPALPVDVRHNAKIHRLQLSRAWTARLKGKPLPPG